jgi:molecular chaperone GrpE
VSAPESDHRQAEAEFEERGPTVRDRRRIDPETYQVREPQETAAPAAAAPKPENTEPETTEPENTEPENTEPEGPPVRDLEAEVKELQDKLTERTSDLQRLQAEYVNYKRRVDRDRDLARKVTIEGVLKDFLSVLDDVRSAREHSELSGGFKAVAEEIERVTSKYGLESYGEPGDPFNPHIHEALLHAHADGIEGPTCVEILQPGYRIGDRILRPARVAVAEPEPESMRPEPVEARPEPFDELRTSPVEARVEEPSTSSGDHDESSAERLVEATGEPGADKPDADADQQ